MNARAIFIDMDGTLLNTSNKISRRNIEAIYKLMNRGVQVFLATGKHYEITVPYHKQIGLHTPMICLNGATIHAAKTGRIMQMRTVQLNEERFHSLTAESQTDINFTMRHGFSHILI